MQQWAPWLKYTLQDKVFLWQPLFQVQDMKAGHTLTCHHLIFTYTIPMQNVFRKILTKNINSFTKFLIVFLLRHCSSGGQQDFYPHRLDGAPLSNEAPLITLLLPCKLVPGPCSCVSFILGSYTVSHLHGNTSCFIQIRKWRSIAPLRCNLAS